MVFFYYLYQLYNYITEYGNYLYNLLFRNSYEYEYLNSENNMHTPKSTFNSENICEINYSLHERIIESPSSKSPISESPIPDYLFTDISNSWKCSICNYFNALSNKTCVDCQIDSESIPFLNEVVNEHLNRENILISPITINSNNIEYFPSEMIISEIINELIDIIVEKDNYQKLLDNDWEYLDVDEFIMKR